MTALHILVLALILVGFALWVRRRRQQSLQVIETVVFENIGSRVLDDRRDITVFLPPNYHQRESERFDVLYLNDGQEWESLGLRETLAKLTTTGRIRPIIVVAVPTGANRMQEYGTAVAMNDHELGTQAAEYSQFIVDELMPEIDDLFRTRPGATILGVSLGGLSAFDIAWNHPERFSTVGVMSGSFWWRARDDEERIDAGRRIAHSMVRNADRLPPLRFWFQAGTRDEVNDRDGDGVIDAIQDTRELMAALQARGIAPERMRYVEIKGGRHDYETWARALPDFLEWAFSAGKI